MDSHESAGEGGGTACTACQHTDPESAECDTSEGINKRVPLARCRSGFRQPRVRERADIFAPHAFNFASYLNELSSSYSVEASTDEQGAPAPIVVSAFVVAERIKTGSINAILEPDEAVREK